MKAKEFKELLIKLDACEEAVKWCEGKSLQEAWQQAVNSDWMLWLLRNQPNKATDRDLRLIAIKCARQVQHLMKDQRSINALDVAERFANGEATQEELTAAWGAAFAAWDAAMDASWGAWDAWDAAWDAAWAAARAAAWGAWAKQCEIIREYIPEFKIKEQ